MSSPTKGILGDWEATGAEICEVLKIAVQKALREHKKAGRSVVVWDREKDHIVILRPDQIDVPDAPNNN